MAVIMAARLSGSVMHSNGKPNKNVACPSPLNATPALLPSEYWAGHIAPSMGASYVIDYRTIGSKLQKVGVGIGITFVEIAGGDDCDVATSSLNERYLRVNLQTFHSHDDIDAGICHFLTPVYV